jgi:hypothetical protein
MPARASPTSSRSPVGYGGRRRRTAGTTTCLDGFLVALDLSTGEVLGSRTFDGRLAVAECHPQCLRDCPVVDSDRLTAMAADDHGRVVVGGSVFNHDVSTALNFVKRLRIRARHARTPQLPSRACRSSALAMHLTLGRPTPYDGRPTAIRTR